MKKKLKNKINKYYKNLKKQAKEEDFEKYLPKKFGTQKGVSFEMKGITETFCSVTHWANGEGFDINWQTLKNTKTGDWEDKHLSLHRDELEVFMACLENLKEFDND